MEHSFTANGSVVFGGSSSAGRAIAFQAIGREFEPRLPLINLPPFIKWNPDFSHSQPMRKRLATLKGALIQKA
jgi:hypothetical protein